MPPDILYSFNICQINKGFCEILDSSGLQEASWWLSSNAVNIYWINGRVIAWKFGRAEEEFSEFLEVHYHPKKLVGRDSFGIFRKNGGMFWSPWEMILTQDFYHVRIKKHRIFFYLNFSKGATASFQWRSTYKHVAYILLWTFIQNFNGRLLKRRHIPEIKWKNISECTRPKYDFQGRHKDSQKARN